MSWHYRKIYLKKCVLLLKTITYIVRLVVHYIFAVHKLLPIVFLCYFHKWTRYRVERTTVWQCSYKAFRWSMSRNYSVTKNVYFLFNITLCEVFILTDTFDCQAIMVIYNVLNLQSGIVSLAPHNDFHWLSIQWIWFKVPCLNVFFSFCLVLCVCLLLPVFFLLALLCQKV